MGHGAVQVRVSNCVSEERNRHSSSGTPRKSESMRAAVTIRAQARGVGAGPGAQVQAKSNPLKIPTQTSITQHHHHQSGGDPLMQRAMAYKWGEESGGADGRPPVQQPAAGSERKAREGLVPAKLPDGRPPPARRIAAAAAAAAASAG